MAFPGSGRRLGQLLGPVPLLQVVVVAGRVEGVLVRVRHPATAQQRWSRLSTCATRKNFQHDIFSLNRMFSRRDPTQLWHSVKKQKSNLAVLARLKMLCFWFFATNYLAKLSGSTRKRSEVGSDADICPITASGPRFRAGAPFYLPAGALRKAFFTDVLRFLRKPARTCAALRERDACDRRRRRSDPGRRLCDPLRAARRWAAITARPRPAALGQFRGGAALARVRVPLATDSVAVFRVLM